MVRGLASPDDLWNGVPVKLRQMWRQPDIIELAQMPLGRPALVKMRPAIVHRPPRHDILGKPAGGKNVDDASGLLNWRECETRTLVARNLQLFAVIVHVAADRVIRATPGPAPKRRVTIWRTASASACRTGTEELRPSSPLRPPFIDLKCTT